MPPSVEASEIWAPRVVTPEGVIEGATVKIQDGRIQAVRPAGAPEGGASPGRIALEGATLLPGFIDVHVHGGGGWRVGTNQDPQRDTIVEMSRFLATTGVTGFLPTLSTASDDDMEATVRQVAAVVGKELPGADVLGTHLEGPYLNPEKKGAQREELMQPPSRERFLRHWEASGGTIRYMTLAPELEGALELVALLNELGVFASAGHSNALGHEMERAFDAGVRGATHLFNGMRGIQQREPGVAGAALAHPTAWVELIGDGVHVHPTVMRLAIRAKGARGVVIVTDAGAFTGLPDGVYDEGVRVVTVKHGRCLLPDGTLAESMSPMNRNCMVLLSEVGVGWVDIARMTATNPATMLGLQERRGSIEVGKDADLTALGPDGEVLLTTIRGRVVHRQEPA